MICGIQDCYVAVSDSLASNGNWKKIAASESYRATTSPTYAVVGSTVLSALEASPNLFQILDFSQDDNQWETVDFNISSFAYSCMAAINDTSFILIGGGISGKLTQIYNFKTGIWTRLPDMEPGRYGSKCINYMDGIMVVGGECNPTDSTYYTSNDVNFFNLTSNIWQKFPSMNNARYAHILAPVNGIPTVIGGNSGQGLVTYSEQYINGKWNNWIEQIPGVDYHSFVQVSKDDFHC